MDLTIFPGKLSGTVTAIPSKSQAHRLPTCAALAAAPTELQCPETNRDIETTLNIGWKLLSILPKSELKRIKPEYIEKYLPKTPQAE